MFHKKYFFDRFDGFGTDNLLTVINAFKKIKSIQIEKFKKLINSIQFFNTCINNWEAVMLVLSLRGNSCTKRICINYSKMYVRKIVYIYRYNNNNVVRALKCYLA